MNLLTPRQRLLNSKTLVGAHREITGHGAFDLVADSALLEYQRQLLTSSDVQSGFNQAAAAHLKMSGAMEFLKIFLSLSADPEVPKSTAPGNLNHKA